MENTINCPHCNTEINIKSALQNQVSSEVNKEYKEHYAAKDAELKAREKALKENELNEKSQIEQNDILIKKGVEEGVKNLIPNIEKDIGLKYKGVSAEAADIKKELLAYKQKEIRDNQDKKTREAQQNLRDEEVRAEQADKMRAEYEKQREDDKVAHTKELELKGLEADERVKQMEKTFQKGISQASQTSQQIQGEAGEISVENYLNTTYPFDTIESIKTGAKGADYLLKVSDNGRETGRSIYVEVKRHQEFKQPWIRKFKNDIREMNADIGVIATEVMPKGIYRPTCIDGIWIASLTDYEFVMDCLRYNLIELSRVEMVNENALDKQSLVYSFVTSKEFARILDSLYESYKEEQKSLDYEEKAMNKSWGKRRKNLEIIKKTTSSFIGAFQAYSGNNISEVKALQMSEI